MDDYALIRRMFREGQSQRRIAQTLGISRNTVAKYCGGGAIPGIRAAYKRMAKVMTPDVLEFIEECLHEDQLEPNRKQHHTAKRIYDRLVEEQGFKGAESTVRHVVHVLRGNLNEVFVPLVFEPGDAMQIDWGAAYAYIGAERVELNMFCARLAYSCAPFVICFRKQNTEAFLEGIRQAFLFFGGVPRRVIFDNAKVAVLKGSGRSAVPQVAYKMFAAHYCFTPDFCNARRGNEKGLVENLVGLARRNLFVPVPHAASLADLNRMQADRCVRYREMHHIPERKETVAEMFVQDRANLQAMPLVPYDFRTAEICRVSSYATARFQTNNYSVPVQYAGREVTVRASAETVTIYADGKEIARHRRSYDRHQDILDLKHYLPILARKPRSILQAKPVRQNISHRLLEYLEAHRFSAKELMAILELCCAEGEEAFWKGESYFPRHGGIAGSDAAADGPAVDTVDLTRYDSFVPGGEKPCRIPV